MYNTAKKTYYSDDMLCSLVVCCVLLCALDQDRYIISLDQNPFSPFYSRYTPSPIHSTILSFLKQSKLDAAR